MSKESELKKVIKKAKQTIYVEHQKASGLKVGDKVRILRKAKDYENGWDNSWAHPMNRSIGQIDTIISVHDNTGIQLKSDGYDYPFFVLRKVQLEPTKVLRNGKWVKSMNSIKDINDYEYLDHDDKYNYSFHSSMLYRQKRW